MDLRELKESLTKEQIIELLQHEGVKHFIDRDDILIFPTICHNANADDSSLKLYYYCDSKMFHCYTECGESFDIFGLIQRRAKLFGEDLSLADVVKRIEQKIKVEIRSSFKYRSKRAAYQKRNVIDLPTYDEKVLRAALPIFPPEWRREGINNGEMEEYGIRYSIEQNKVIIPHRDIRGNLVGIRTRSFNQEEVGCGNKYMPFYFNGIRYSHPLSLNLYGIYQNQETIRDKKVCIVFEGEKACLSYGSKFYSNIALACCGFSINKYQINLILNELNVNEIVIAFDKEYDKYNSVEGEKYFTKLYSMCKKYSKYCNMSFIFDKEGLLGRSDSPIDKTAESFVRMFNRRIKVS